MSIAKYQALYNLIRAMSKSEKRHFKLYTNRFSSNKNAIFIKLFDTLDSENIRSETYIKRKLDIKNVVQFTNAKRHLFLQILKSIRILYASKHTQISTNEEIDFAIILAHKHLYKSSYDILERIDIPMNEFYTQNLLTITEYKRRISKNISIENVQLENVIGNTRLQLELDWQIDDLSNELTNDFYLLSYSRNNREHTLRTERFESKLDLLRNRNLTTLQQYNLHQLYIQFYETIANHKLIYWHALHQIELLKELPYQHNEDHYINLFTQCCSTLISITCLFRKKDKFIKWLEILNSKINYHNDSREKHGSHNREIPVQIKLFNIAIQNDFSMLNIIKSDLYTNSLDRPQKLKYQLATVYAYKGDYDTTINMLNEVLQNDKIPTDILLYSRLLLVMCHYRLNNFQLVDNLLPGLRLAFKTNGYFNKTINIILTTLGKGVKALNFGMKDEINEMQEKLKVYSETQYEKIPFLYFDFYYWFESIKLNIPKSDIKINI